MKSSKTTIATTLDSGMGWKWKVGENFARNDGSIWRCLCVDKPSAAPINEDPILVMNIITGETRSYDPSGMNKMSQRLGFPSLPEAFTGPAK